MCVVCVREWLCVYVCAVVVVVVCGGGVVCSVWLIGGINVFVCLCVG